MTQHRTTNPHPQRRRCCCAAAALSFFARSRQRERLHSHKVGGAEDALHDLQDGRRVEQHAPFVLQPEMRGGATEAPTRSPTMSFAPTLSLSPSFAPTGVPLCEPQCEYDGVDVAGRGLGHRGFGVNALWSSFLASSRPAARGFARGLTPTYQRFTREPRHVPRARPLGRRRCQKRGDVDCA